MREQNSSTKLGMNGITDAHIFVWRKVIIPGLPNFQIFRFYWFLILIKAECSACRSVLHLFSTSTSIGVTFLKFGRAGGMPGAFFVRAARHLEKGFMPKGQNRA